MKNLILRCITGIVYIGVILMAIFTSMPVFFSVFGVIMLFALNEFYKNLKVKGISVDFVISNVLAVCIYLYPIVMYYTDGFSMLPAIILLALCLFAVELFRENDNPFHRIAFSLCGIVYTSVPFSLLAFYMAEFGDIDYLTASLPILFMFILIWSNDTFAYCTGMLLGKHPLCPKISPKKTIEGFVGGLIFTVAIALGCEMLWGSEENIDGVIVISIVIVILSTLGDMTESRFKRYVGVKDSGKMLPGHGGFLDRFDSVIFTIPAFFAYLQLFN